MNLASQELDAIRELARRLLTQHEELVSEVADALRRAKDEAPKEPGFLDRLVSSLADGIKKLASDTWKWVQDHADVIAQFGDIMSKISTALAMLAIATAPFEPVGAIFAGVAAGTALVALGAHGLAKAAGADVGWGSLVGDALGALPFVGGVARGAKVATSAERALGAASEDVLSYGASRATAIGGEVVKKSVTTSAKGVEKAYSVIKADGVVGRLDTGIESAYQSFREGQAVGTKGLNMAIEKLGGTGGIDPLSVGGRALDAGIKGGRRSPGRSSTTSPGRTARHPGVADLQLAGSGSRCIMSGFTIELPEGFVELPASAATAQVQRLLDQLAISFMVVRHSCCPFPLAPGPGS